MDKHMPARLALAMPTPQPSTPQPALAKAKRQPRLQQLQALYVTLYGQLDPLCHQYQPSLSFMDQPKVMAELAGNLWRYRGPINPGSFLQWASRRIKRSASQYVLTEQILKAHRAKIKFTIRQAMQSFALDAAVDERDISQDVALLIFRYALSLTRKGTAQQKYRIDALIKKHVWSYYIRKRKNRLRLVTKYKTTLGVGGCSFLSDAELASQRWDDAEPDYCPAPLAA